MYTSSRLILWLPVLAIYGANAAGKSNVLHAMMTMKEMVVGNAAKVSKGQKLPWEPFGGTKVPTSFEMVFIFQGVRYTYGFSFDAKKIYKVKRLAPNTPSMVKEGMMGMCAGARVTDAKNDNSGFCTHLLPPFPALVLLFLSREYLVSFV